MSWTSDTHVLIATDYENFEIYKCNLNTGPISKDSIVVYDKNGDKVKGITNISLDFNTIHATFNITVSKVNGTKLNLTGYSIKKVS